MCSTLLYSFVKCQETDVTHGKCVCHHGGAIYNLAPLQSTDETDPRFRAKGKHHYVIYYNPCSSFRLGDKCVHDVAVCKAPINDATHLKIGDQSTASCGTDTKTGNPQLVYKTADYNETYEHVKVNLICDKTKRSITEASFVQDPDNVWTYHLTHNCACANGCPVYSSTTPSTTDSGSDWKHIWEPVSIAAGSVVFVFAVIAVIWLLLLLKRQRYYIPNDNNQEGRHLLGEGDSGIGETTNKFPDSSDGKRSANLRNVSPPLSISSASSCSDITVSKKDDFNNTKAASVPV